MPSKQNQPPAPSPPPDDPLQSKRFEEAARECGADDATADAFERAMDRAFGAQKVQPNGARSRK